MSLITNLCYFIEFENTGNDSTINGINFTNNNAATFNTGIVGQATQLVAASSQYWSRTSGALLQPGPDMSLQAWIYADTLVNDGVFYGIVQKDGGGADRTFNLSFQTTMFRFFVFDSGVGNQAALSLPFSSLATWTQLIVTYDSSDKKPRIIVNDGSPVVGSALAAGINTTGTAEVQIGRYLGGFWNGRIDQVGFWQRVLSASEITQLYNNGAGMSFAQMAAYPRQTASNRQTALNRQTASNRTTASGRRNVS